MCTDAAARGVWRWIIDDAKYWYRAINIESWLQTHLTLDTSKVRTWQNLNDMVKSRTWGGAPALALAVGTNVILVYGKDEEALHAAIAAMSF